MVHGKTCDNILHDMYMYQNNVEEIRCRHFEGLMDCAPSQTDGTDV